MVRELCVSEGGYSRSSSNSNVGMNQVSRTVDLAMNHKIRKEKMYPVAPWAHFEYESFDIL